MQHETFETVDESYERLNRTGYPCHYFGDHGSWFQFLGRHRDSDLLTESNWDVAKADLDAYEDDHEDGAYVIESASHWAVGWVETILINPANERAVAAATDMLRAMEDYPVLDESDWSEKESEEQYRQWCDWGARDVISALSSRFEGYPRLSDAIDNLDFADIEGLIVANDIYLSESWCGDSIDPDMIAEEITDEMIVTLAMKKRPGGAVRLGGFVRFDPNQLHLF